MLLLTRTYNDLLKNQIVNLKNLLCIKNILNLISIIAKSKYSLKFMFKKIFPNFICIDLMSFFNDIQQVFLVDDFDKLRNFIHSQVSNCCYSVVGGDVVFLSKSSTSSKKKNKLSAEKNAVSQLVLRAKLSPAFKRYFIV